MNELDTKDPPKITKRAGELWRSLGDDEKAVFESRAKAAMDAYEKEKHEYENRSDVRERLVKERVQELKGFVAAATREVAKAMAQLERFQADFESASKDLEEIKQEKKAAAKKDAEREKAAAKKEAEEKAAAKKEAEREKAAAKKDAEKEKAAAKKEADKEKAAAKKDAEKEKAAAKKEAEKVKQQSKDTLISKKRAERPNSTAEPSEAKRARSLDANLLAEAGDLASALENLAQRPGMSEITGEQLLKALRDNDGLVNKAKNALSAAA